MSVPATGGGQWRGSGGATLASQVAAAVGPTLWESWLPGPSYFFTDAAKTVPCGNGDLIRVWAGATVGRDLSQATSGKRPVAALVGGKWLARFDPVDDVIAYAAALPTPVTVFCRFSYSITASVLPSVWGAGGSGSNEFGLAVRVDQGGKLLMARMGIGASANTTPLLAVGTVGTAVVTTSSAYAGPMSGLVGKDSPASVAASINYGESNSPFSVGPNLWSGQSCDLDVTAVVIASSVLSAPAQQSVIDLLSTL